MISKIETYANTQKKVRYNNDLVAKIENILRAEIINLWSGPIEYLPKETAIWVELWLSGGAELYEDVNAEFTTICDLFDIQIGEGFHIISRADGNSYKGKFRPNHRTF